MSQNKKKNMRKSKRKKKNMNRIKNKRNIKLIVPKNKKLISLKQFNHKNYKMKKQ